MSSGSDRVTGAALLVGVGNYHSDQIQPLRYAAQDAQAMSELLGDPAVCGFSENRIALLTDQEASRANILSRLIKWFPGQAGGADVAIIYFACHGAQKRLGSSEEGYLLPFDADPDDVVTHGIAMTEVAHQIADLGARTVVVILDCCHAGHVLSRDGAAMRSNLRDMTLRPAVIERLSGKNRILIASCDDGQMSIESDRHKHGLFTYHLLEGLRGRADRDADGKVGIAELFHYVSAEVARDARDEFRCEQKPWFKGTWTEEIFLSTPGLVLPEPSGPANPHEKLWRDLGADGAMTELENRLSELPEDSVRAALEFLRQKREPAAIPFLFGCLAQDSEIVRRRARSLLLGHGWPTVTAACTELARACEKAAEATRMDLVLQGLQAIESNPDVIALLNRLVELLRSGKLRDRAIALLDHKRLSADLDRVAALFLETKQPFRVEKLLGPGMFTAAYVASHQATGRRVVVRVLRPQFVADDFVRARFYEVGERSYGAIHQNLASTRDVGSIPDRQAYFVVRDYIDGATLKDVLAKGKHFDPPQVLEILRQVVRALSPIHEVGAQHGGIKPSNIFLSGEGQVRVIVGDLGLGIVYLHVERLGYDCRYLAPEVFQGQVGATPKSDFYAIGCVGYELLCGEPPFVSDRPAELMFKHTQSLPTPPSERGSKLGPRGDAFFARLLAKNPADRFGTPGEVLRALDRLDPEFGVDHAVAPPPASILPPGSESLKDFDPMKSIISLDRSLMPELPGGILGNSPKKPDEERELRSDHDRDTWIPAPRDQTFFPAPDRPASGTGFGSPSDLSFPTWVPSSDSGRAAEVDSPSDSPSSTSTPSSDSGRTGEFDLLPPPLIRRGEVVFGAFRLLEQLGEGGMGAVWLVDNLELERKSALKLIKPEIAQNEKGWRRFRREAILMAKLVHPNAVTVYGANRMHSMGYIEMEFVRGKSLDKVLKERQGEPMPLESVIPILDQLCAVLQEAHDYVDERGKPRPIIHRDLKPSNIMLVDRKPAGQNLKVLDFGIAKMMEDDPGSELTLTNAGDILGTPAYMSPEQITGGWGDGQRNDIDCRSDLYSVGLILYQLLTGTLPFRNSNPRALMAAHLMEQPRPMKEANPQADVPAEVEKVVLRCLEKDPRKRFSSASELHEAFCASCNTSPAWLPRMGQAHATGASKSFSRRKVAVAAAILLGLLAALALWKAWN